MTSFLRVLILLLLAYLVIAGLIYAFQRSLLFHPSQRAVQTVMEPWVVEGRKLGYQRAVAAPTGVWLVFHGNGGQAAHRDYLLDHLDPDTTVVVLEYPGYGDRPGQPSAATFDAAAAEAYAVLSRRHPDLPIGVLGESIGSGPASRLAAARPRPAKVVLLVPFDQLYRVARDRFWWLPVRWLMRDQWDNGAALREYTGPIEIYAAPQDEIIPFKHAERLAARLPQARLIKLPGGHNSWEFNQNWVLPTGTDLAPRLD